MADDQNQNDRLSYDSDKGFFDNLATWAQKINSARDPDVMSANAYEFYRNHGYDHDAAMTHADDAASRFQSRANRTGHIANAVSYLNPISGPARVMGDVASGASADDPLDALRATPIGAGASLLATGAQKGYDKAKGYLGYASGGDVDKALQIAGAQPKTDPVALAQQTLAAPRPAPTKGQQKLMGTFQQENRPAAVVSPKPGTGGTEDSPGWSFSTPTAPGEDRPPPMQAPVRETPRLGNISDHVQRQMKTKGFKDLVRDVAGIHKMDVTPTTGSWMGKVEPSFIINGYGPNGEEATPAQIRKLSHLLGFGYQQDAVVEHHHNPNIEEGVPTMYVGKGKKLDNADLDNIHAASQNHGLDFTRTKDGMGVKFSHYGDEKDTPEQAEQKHNAFMDKVKSVADQTGMPDRLHVRTAGDLKYAKGYLDEIFGGASGQEGLPPGSARSPDLFGRVVDHVLAPYAKAAASEGYRLSPERLGETYGLTPDEVNRVREGLYPSGKKDRSTVPLMDDGPDAEKLDVRPTGKGGKPVVDDVLYALQNRAASSGQIDPTDHSDAAKKMIAKHMADEVEHHASGSGKSAIGWYDSELKKAKDKYAAIFPEIKKDPQKALLFDTILGITSQGNDVHSNSVFAARLYNTIRDGKTSLQDATEQQAGTMGEQTKAIEYNLNKLHHLLENNSPEELASKLDKKQTVSDWNKQLKADKSLHNFDGNPLSVDGRADQKVTGWSVFGPKIGSFINNLRGDYSTLTADLWFSRSWNRLLGHNFLHTPLQEAAQYRDFRDAMHAEYAHHHPDEMSPVQPNKTRQGKVATDAEGNPQPWLHGSDMKNMSQDEFDAHINDPELMLEKAKEIYDKYSSPNKETGKGAFSEKSDLRRRAKNWVESRYNPVAAPRGDEERGFQQDTAEEAQKMLKKRGIDISIADIQAALWYHEKDLFGKYGVAGSRQAPASYSDAADKTVQLHQSGRLYDNWSDIQKEIKADQKAAREEERAKLKAEKDAQKAARDEERAALKAEKASAKAKPKSEFATGGEVRGSRPFDLGDDLSYPQGGDANEPDNKIAATPRSVGPQAGGFPQQGSLRGGQGVLYPQGARDDQSPLEGLPTKVSIPRTGETLTAAHDPRIRAIAADYMQTSGQQYSPPRKYVKVDPARGKRIADEYESMKHDPHHPLVKASYDALAKETIAQYNHAKAAGLKLSFWNPDEMEDPYAASPRLMTEDVRKNHHMYVFPTDYGYGNEPISDRDREENPMLRDTGETWNGKPVLVNDMFRAIHDYFGHAKEGVGFRGDGEENAWRSHASMYSPLARLALGTETRGQNSWLNYGPHGEKNRTASTEETVFAPPKIGLMPSWVHHEGGEDFTLPEHITAMQEIHKRHGKAEGGEVDGFEIPRINNPVSVFPKPQRMFPEDARPAGGQYLNARTKEDMTGHKASIASIGINPGGRPYFNASPDSVDQTGSPGRGSAMAKTNLFKQKAGWKWLQAPEGHEDTNTIVSVEHRGNHHYALNAHFPKGVELARYSEAKSEPRLRPTTQGNLTKGNQVGSISVRGKEHPVYDHVIVKAGGGSIVDRALMLTSNKA